MKPRVLSVLVVALAFAATGVAAPSKENNLRGRVWVDADFQNVHIAVDAAENGAVPDGVIDYEFTLLVQPGAVQNESSEEFADAIVRTTARWVLVVAPGERRSVVLSLTGDPAPPTAPTIRALREDTSAIERFETTSFQGYGLRYSDAMKATIGERRSARELAIRTNANCDAGGACGAASCSVECGPDRSCSISCNPGYTACCYCGGPNQNLPLCSCTWCSG